MDPFKAALGLKRSASKEEIKQAYRKLALQFHPDKHSHSSKSVQDGATLRFRFVSQAYEALMDECKRSDNNPSSSNSNNNNNRSSSSIGIGSNNKNNGFKLLLEISPLEVLWKMQNPKKSYEDYVESKEKANATEDTFWESPCFGDI